MSVWSSREVRGPRGLGRGLCRLQTLGTLVVQNEDVPVLDPTPFPFLLQSRASPFDLSPARSGRHRVESLGPVGRAFRRRDSRRRPGSLLPSDTKPQTLPPGRLGIRKWPDSARHQALETVRVRARDPLLSALDP